MQSDEAAPLYWPDGQSTHTPAPATEYVPAEHGSQSAELSWYAALVPSSSMAVPAGHGLHAELPVDDVYVPDGHTVQLDAPSALYEPPGHGKHVAAPSLE